MSHESHDTESGLPVAVSTNSAYVPDLAGQARDTNGPMYVPAGPKFTPGAFLKALGRRWLLATVLGLLLGSAAAVGLWFLLPDSYTSYALLRITMGKPSVLPSNGSGQAPDEERRKQQTQVALITSKPIIIAALSDPKVRDAQFFHDQPDPADWLASRLKVAFLEKTDIVRIALSGNDPGELAKLVNAVKDAYLRAVVKAERDRQLELLNNVEKVYVASQEKLRGDREVLAQLAETLHTSDSAALTLKQKIALEQYASLEAEVARINSQLRDAQIRLAVLKRGGAPPDQIDVPESMVEDYLDRDPLVQARLTDMVKLQEKATADAATIRPDSSIGRENARKLAAAKEALAKVRAQRREDVVRKLRLTLSDRARLQSQQLVHQKADEISILEAQKKALQQEVHSKQKDAERIGTKSFDLENRRNDIEQAETMIKSLRAEKERLTVELQVNQSQVTPLWDAEAPVAPDRNARVQLAIAGGLGVFLLCLGWVGYSEWRVQRITSSAEVTQDLGMRVIGSLPALPTRARVPVVSGPGGTDSDLILLESIDSIRAMLLCDDTIRSHRILMVTSAGSREGKTTLASHLATSIARVGHSTVLVDADFRRPVIHRLFDLEPTVGLSDVLMNKAPLSEAIVPSTVSGLSLLPAGPFSRRAIPTLSQQSLRKVFEELRKSFEFVIVDACPVLPVADALVLGKCADGVLLSVRPQISQAPLVTAAYDRLSSLGIHVLGVVVTGVRERLKDYEYLYSIAPRAGESSPFEGPTSESS